MSHMGFRNRCRMLLLGLLVPLALTPGAAQESSGLRLSTPEEIAKEFESVPCDNQARLAAVRALYERMGARDADFRLDRFADYNGVENLVLTVPGESPEKIVIGAHYDKIGDGCGAVDNWTGQVAVAHLYRTLRQLHMKKTLVFVAFGREENGLVGSRAMVTSIPPDQIPTYCGMVNIDSLGLARPQVADNMSSRTLERLAAALAKDMGIPFRHASLGRANSDSSSFASKKIPAVTIHGLDNNWTQVLHRREDQASKVNPMSVYLGYRLALSMIAQLNESPCDAYR